MINDIFFRGNSVKSQGSRKSCWNFFIFFLFRFSLSFAFSGHRKETSSDTNTNEIPLGSFFVLSLSLSLSLSNILFSLFPFRFYFYLVALIQFVHLSLPLCPLPSIASNFWDSRLFTLRNHFRCESDGVPNIPGPYFSPLSSKTVFASFFALSFISSFHFFWERE